MFLGGQGVKLTDTVRWVDDVGSTLPWLKNTNCASWKIRRAHRPPHLSTQNSTLPPLSTRLGTLTGRRSPGRRNGRRDKRTEDGGDDGTRRPTRRMLHDVIILVQIVLYNHDKSLGKCLFLSFSSWKDILTNAGDGDGGRQQIEKYHKTTLNNCFFYIFSPRREL